MRHARLFGIAAVAAMLAAGAAPAYAQVDARFDIPFPFIAAGKTMPAGMYDISESSPALLTIRSSADPKAEAALVPITRLAQGAAPLTQTEVVFDKADNGSYLSEIWMAGEDGVLVYATKGPHTHSRLKAVKK